LGLELSFRILPTLFPITSGSLSMLPELRQRQDGRGIGGLLKETDELLHFIDEQANEMPKQGVSKHFPVRYQASLSRA
jgi:hypothetical protein